MGGVLHAVFGGGSSKSSSTQTSTATSGNNAFPMLQQQYGGAISTGNDAFSRIAALLGLGGDKGAAEGGLQNYLASSGHQFMLDTGSKAITNNKATAGLLNSGATLKAQTKYGQDLASTGFNNYLTNLMGLYNGGVAGAGTIAGSGGFSNSSSSGKSTGSAANSTGIVNSLFGS